MFPTMKLFVVLAVLFSCVVALIPEKDFKPRVFILSDIGNEPDDSQSLVRTLLYLNEIDLKGFGVSTSTWLNSTIHPELAEEIISAYEEVLPNLLNHSDAYPSAKEVRKLVSNGKAEYGLNALKNGTISAAAKKLIAAVEDTPEDDQLFVLVWGGATILAEALNYVQLFKTDDQLEAFVDKITTYTISDQDDAGPWIRQNFPTLKYIASVHGFNQYGSSTWYGISGDLLNRFDFDQPNRTLVEPEWVANNIQNVSALGAVYPDTMFIMEGDSPSFLFTIPNGLNDPYHPNYGGWGGRYTLTDRTNRVRHYGDASDQFEIDDDTYYSNRGTVWRWRAAFQHNFAARMQWTVKDFDDAVHEPIAVVNGSESYFPVEYKVDVDSEVVLDFSDSYDLNDRDLEFNVFQYLEASPTPTNAEVISKLNITLLNDEGSIVSVQIPSAELSCKDQLSQWVDCFQYHIIAEVKNDGEAVGYKRVILKSQK